MINIIRITAALVLIVGAGLANGVCTNRWGSSAALAALPAKFASVPMQIGDWKATSFEMDPRERVMAGATAYLSRRYDNPSRGVSVSVMLLGGLPGKIATHTPDVCYGGAGYTMSPPAPYTYGRDSDRAGFQTILASRVGTSPSTLRIFWSWRASEGWLAPEDARWKFASEPALCKLYVLRETNGQVVKPEDDPCNDFLSVFLPELDRLVFSDVKPVPEKDRGSRPK